MSTLSTTAAPPLPMGVRLALTPDITPLVKHLERLIAGSNFEPLRRQIGEYMVGEVQDNLDGQKLFDGSPMPQSKAAEERGGETLIDHHHLYDSYVYQLADGGVEVGSALVYARIHHAGGLTGRAGHRFEMEPRPVLGVGPEQDEHIGGLILADLQAIEDGAVP